MSKLHDNVLYLTQRKDSALREAVISRYEERYKGFGPTLACEKLEKEGYLLDHETTLTMWE